MAQASNYTAQFADAIAFERATYATGLVTQDDFYTVDPAWTDAAAGSLLRVKPLNLANYTLPPAIAGSRFLYQSESFNGSKTPTSGVVLFPFAPRKLKDGTIPVALWAHGTAGLYANGAPSHFRNLWQHWMAPFPLVLQGYIVIMPDYSGLGVSVDGAEKPIVHEYLASPAAAKDLEYGLKAAQEAFPLVGKKFVVLGHSQGGAVAWSFAERMYEFPMDGYLGVVPMAPVTRLLDESDHMRPVLAAGALWGMENIFPEFDMNTILTPDGVERMKADKALGGNVAVTGALFFGADLFKPGWETNEYVQRFQELTHAGGKGFRGPMLLLQGLSDPLISHSVTSEAAKRTADICPKASIKYVQYHDISHVPTAYVSQRLWLDWIKSRFDDEPVEPGLVEEHMESLLPAESYVPETNWFLALGVKYYETP